VAFRIRARLEGDERFRRALARGSNPRVARRALGQIGARVQRTIQTRFLSGQVLNVRSGGLRRSVTTDASDLPRSISVGTPSPAAPTHEAGAVIRPRRARLLTIPLDAAQTGAGVARFTARGAARQFDATFWQRSRAGNLILFGKRGDQLVPLFLGLRKVTIPQRSFMEPALEREREGMSAVWAAEAERAIREAR